MKFTAIPMAKTGRATRGSMLPFLGRERCHDGRDARCNAHPRLGTTEAIAVAAYCFALDQDGELVLGLFLWRRFRQRCLQIFVDVAGTFQSELFSWRRSWRCRGGNGRSRRGRRRRFRGRRRRVGRLFQGRALFLIAGRVRPKFQRKCGHFACVVFLHGRFSFWKIPNEVSAAIPRCVKR